MRYLVILIFFNYVVVAIGTEKSIHPRSRQECHTIKARRSLGVGQASQSQPHLHSQRREMN